MVLGVDTHTNAHPNPHESDFKKPGASRGRRMLGLKRRITAAACKGAMWLAVSHDNLDSYGLLKEE